MLAAVFPLSEHGAPLTPLLHRGRTEHGSDGLVEYCLEAPLGERGALQVLHGPNLSGHGQALRVGDRGELLVPQPLNGVLVISQIQLGAHQDDGCVGAVVSHLRVPLCSDVLKGGRTDQGEAHQEHIRLRV